MIQEAMEMSREAGIESQSIQHTSHLGSVGEFEQDTVTSRPNAFVSPDLPLMNAELIEDESELSLVEQGMVRGESDVSSNLDAGPRIRRNSRGQMKRIQPRTSSRRRIASTRRKDGKEPTRRFSSLLNRVRNGISGLREQGIDEEIVELMAEHIPEEEENTVPSSFSALTESQEVAPMQTGQHGLRRLD